MGDVTDAFTDDALCGVGYVQLSQWRPGQLVLARRGPDADGIKFGITLGCSASKQQDDRYAIVGQVLGSGLSDNSLGEAEALSPLRYLDAAGSANGAPRKGIIVAACGVCSETDL